MNVTARSLEWEALFPPKIDDLLHHSIAGVEPPGLRHVLGNAVTGGKRIRPILTALACAAAGGDEQDTLEAGAAIELLHTSSLVHDDIMDEADLRRGAPTIVKQNGTSMAVLAGDALLALSFRLIHSITSPRKDEIQRVFTTTFLNLCEGQCADIRVTESSLDETPGHSWMVERKTARLIEACTTIGGLLAPYNPNHVRALSAFGLALGLAYQATDDLLDANGNEMETGKTGGLDHRNGRQTYLTLAYPERNSAEEIRRLIRNHTAAGCRALESLPPSSSRDRLVGLAMSLLDRRH